MGTSQRERLEDFEDYNPDQSVLNPENPASLFSVMPEEFQPLIEAIRLQFPRMCHYPERELRKYCKPDERDNRIRLSFWQEYELSTRMGKKMSIRAITDGICSKDTWKTYYLQQPKKLLWIVTQPKSYSQTMNALHAQSLERLHQILKLPIKDKQTKKPDVKVIAQMIKIFQLLDLRVKGSIMQRVEINQKSLNMNMNHDVSPEKLLESEFDKIANMSIEELEQMSATLDRNRTKIERVAKALPPDEREELELHGKNIVEAKASKIVGSLSLDEKMIEMEDEHNENEYSG